MKYAFIQRHSNNFAVSAMCSMYDVSKSAYYRWLDNPVGKRDLRNHDLDRDIYAIFMRCEMDALRLSPLYSQTFSRTFSRTFS